MKLARKVPESCDVLQELLSNPPSVTQSDLSEYLRLQAAFELAKIDLEATGGEITEMLVMGSPVQSGPYGARLVSGRLKVDSPAD